MDGDHNRCAEKIVGGEETAMGKSWSNFETGECFAELFLDQDLGTGMDLILIEVEERDDMTDQEKIGFLYALIDAYIWSEDFMTSLTEEDLEEVDVLEIARVLMMDYEDGLS